MDIKAKLVKALDSGNTRAIFDVTLDDKFVIHGVKLINGEKGNFVAMPSNSYKTKSGELKHDDVAHPLDAETRARMYRAVQDAYFDYTHPKPREPDAGQLPFGM